MFNRKIATRAAALALIGGAGVAALGSAAPAFADTPTSSAQATVTVTQSINFAFDSGTSFALAPNQISRAATVFTVSTNDGAGFHLMMSAPDPATLGGAHFQASSLQYDSYDGGGGNLNNNGTQSLSNTPARRSAGPAPPTASRSTRTGQPCCPRRRLQVITPA